MSIIQHISSDNKGITLDNGRPFLVESNFVNIISTWTVGDSVKVEKLQSASPFSYEITNLNNGNTIIAAYHP